jgi:hypothetical protein
MVWYKAGTVTVTNASAVVTGAGTAFIQNVRAGDGFIGPNGVTHEIVSVDSGTQITISPVYSGATAAGQAYRVQPSPGWIVDLNQGVNTLLNDFSGIRDGIGSGNFPDGTAAAPALRFGADSDTGLYRIGANVLGFAVGGVEQLRVATDGLRSRYTPGDNRAKLAVSNTIDGTALAPAYSEIQLRGGGGDSEVATISAYNSYINAAETGLIFSLRNSANAFGERMRLTGTGNLGLGTVSPSSKLHVSGTNATILTVEATSAGATDTQLRILTPDRDWRVGQNVGGGGAGVLLFYDVTAGSPRFAFDPGGSVRPGTDNAQSLGASAYRWSVVYAGTGTINTSDEEKKAWRDGAGAAELSAARRIAAELGFYQWNDAVAEKGLDGARLHFGVRAQRVWAIMADEGLIDPIAEGATPDSRYAFLCYDEWDALPAIEEVRDEDDNVIASAVPARPAGNRFGIRPDQLALFLIAAQEARLAALEAA